MAKNTSMACRINREYPKPNIGPLIRKPNVSWWFWRGCFDNISKKQRELFLEIAKTDPIAVEVVFRFFCLDGQTPTNRETISAWYNCSGATIYGKIGAVLALLFPRVFKQKSCWIDEELLRLRGALDETRKQKELEEIGKMAVQSFNLRIPRRCWRKRTILQLAIMAEAQEKGVFEKLRKLDVSAYEALRFRFGMVDGKFHTEKETGTWLAGLRITDSARVGRANKVLLRGISILAGEVYGQVSLKSISQIRKSQKRRRR